MDKKSVESAVIKVVQDSHTGISPVEIRETLEKQGVAAQEVRNAVARLADRGVIHIDTNMKVYIRS